MEYAADSKMSKYLDNYTIDKMKVPSLVLMEKAALRVAEKAALKAAAFSGKVRIAAVCGCGNNGADGIAAARILNWQGIKTDIIIVGNEELATEEFKVQKQIGDNSGLNYTVLKAENEYDIIIDAVFGIGLSRVIEGSYADVINRINDSGAYIISVDIPSGINADNGEVMGIAVKADETVTFGYNKIGMMLYTGKEYAGQVTVADIGFAPDVIKSQKAAIYFTKEDIKMIPQRITNANKGTYGRTLIIAGSKNMSGAAYLSAAAAYRCGCGLVEVFTHEKAAPVIKNLLPEAIVTEYNDRKAVAVLKKIIQRADYIVLGPGLSQSVTSQNIVEFVLRNGKIPLILDADALNIISKKPAMLKIYKSTVIITPHIGEMARLTNCAAADIKQSAVNTALSFARDNRVICILKDAVSVVTEPQGEYYINTSGCQAMAKGGSGDVLTGVIAGMLAVGLEPFYAAMMGVYVHGLAGELAAKEQSMHSVTASDMLDKFGQLLS